MEVGDVVFEIKDPKQKNKLIYPYVIVEIDGDKCRIDNSSDWFVLEYFEPSKGMAFAQSLGMQRLTLEETKKMVRRAREYLMQ